MPPRLRLPVSLLACLVAPALAGLTVGLGSTVLAHLTGSASVGGGSLLELGPALLIWAAYPVILGTPPMLLIGLPIQAWMTRRGATAVYWYIPPAALVGGLILVILMRAPSAEAFATGALYGGLAGLFAWLIRRPDKDAQYTSAPFLT